MMLPQIAYVHFEQFSYHRDNSLGQNDTLTNDTFLESVLYSAMGSPLPMYLLRGGKCKGLFSDNLFILFFTIKVDIWNGIFLDSIRLRSLFTLSLQIDMIVMFC